MKLKDSGSYSCIAKNALGTSKKVFIVKILKSPVFFEKLDNITLFGNETKDVECIALGYPIPQVYWTFNDEKIHDGEELEFDSSMKPGVYSCIAENSEGKVGNSFFFKPMKPPTLLEPTQRQIDVPEGNELELACPFQDFDEIFWRQKGVLVNDHTGDKLFISKVDQTYHGEVECTAANSVGSSSFSYQVNVLIPPTFVVVDSITSRVSQEKSATEEKALKFGQSTEMNCEAEGFPLPTTRWIRENKTIAEGEILKIDDVTFDDVGIYICEVKNSQGTAMKVFTVKIQSVPYIVDGIKAKSDEKFVGESLTLSCNVEGSPAPHIVWTRNK